MGIQSMALVDCSRTLIPEIAVALAGLASRPRWRPRAAPFWAASRTLRMGGACAGGCGRISICRLARPAPERPNRNFRNNDFA
jgi:hypothetical protein